jgi:hypothetical protein
MTLTHPGISAMNVANNLTPKRKNIVSSFQPKRPHSISAIHAANWIEHANWN